MKQTRTDGHTDGQTEGWADRGMDRQKGGKVEEWTE